MPENCHKGPFLMGTVTYSISVEKWICLHQKEIPSLDKTPVRVTDHTHFPDSPPRPSPRTNPSLSTVHPQCQTPHYLPSTPNVNPFTVYLPSPMSNPSLSTFHPQCQSLHCLPSTHNVNTVPSLSTFHPQCQYLHCLPSTPNVNTFTVYLPPPMSVPSLSTFHPFPGTTVSYLHICLPRM